MVDGLPVVQWEGEPGVTRVYGKDKKLSKILGD